MQSDWQQSYATNATEYAMLLKMPSFMAGDVKKTCLQSWQKSPHSR